MSETVRTWTASGLGSGKPDYQQEVMQSVTRWGYTLKYDEVLKIFAVTCTNRASLFPTRKPLLAVASEVHTVDLSTGVDTPFTVPAGYEWEILQCIYTGAQPATFWFCVDGQPFTLAEMDSFSFWYMHYLRGFKTTDIDPTAALPHTIDGRLFNEGIAPLQGFGLIVSVMRPVGTPELPKTKTCKCPFCDYKQEEDFSATRIICGKCGGLYVVAYYPIGGRLLKKEG